jgi:hypothetical protein
MCWKRSQKQDARFAVFGARLSTFVASTEQIAAWAIAVTLEKISYH